MLRINTIIWSTLLFLFLSFTVFLATILNLNYTLLSRNTLDYFSQSRIGILDTILSSTNEKVCNIIYVIRNALANKSINTTDRISLNQFFIPLLENNPWVHSIEVILPNGFEYKIRKKSNTWETISQIYTGKNVSMKNATWTKDGVQLLEEIIEEIPVNLLLRNSDWYKNSISLCVRQNTLNRSGVPKIWISEPKLDEEKSQKISTLCFAVGYEDAPYSAISLQMDWSWFSDLLSKIYNDWNIQSYVFREKDILFTASSKNINTMEIDSNLSENHILAELLEILNIDSSKDNFLIIKKENFIFIKKPFELLIDFPIVCVFKVPVPASPNYSVLSKQLLLPSLVFFLFICFSALVLTYSVKKPILVISQWLENPQMNKTVLEEKKYWAFEYNVLIKKLQSVFNFFIEWTSHFLLEQKDSQRDILPFEHTLSSTQKEQEQSKELFVFSDSGIGGVTLETVQQIAKENIRLQRHIEALNQYYLQQIEQYSNQKTKIQTTLSYIKDIVGIMISKDIKMKSKIHNILETICKNLNVTHAYIFWVDKENSQITSYFVFPTMENIVLNLDECRYLIDNLYWSEVINIRSSKSDFRIQPFNRFIKANSFLFTSIIQTPNTPLHYFLAIPNDTERNWDWIDELFTIITSKLIAVIVENTKQMSNEGPQ